jgi:hypothetical protein
VAQCSAGKSELVMTTPSGKTRIMCVPDQAIGGIENAADHSAGEIIATCPCWNAEEVQKFASTGMRCDFYEGTTEYRCWNDYTVLGFVLDGRTEAPYCANRITDVAVKPISALELDACRALLDAGAGAKCPCWSASELEMLFQADRLLCKTDGVDFYCGAVTLVTSKLSCQASTGLWIGPIEAPGELEMCRTLLQPYLVKQ